MASTSSNPADESEDVRLRLQRLPGPAMILSLAALAQARSSDDTFTTKDVQDLMVRLRIPAMANVSAALGRLRGQTLLINPSSKTWALTPEGEARLRADSSSTTTASLSVALDAPRGAVLAEVTQTTIPPFLGPEGTAGGIDAILDASPFEQNVMLITRFPKDEEDHYGKLIEKLREAVAAHGLTLHLASDANRRDTLWENVNTYMWACKYAIVLMDSADGVLNSNVLIEIGGMLMTGRRCAILRDKSVPQMPSDLVGHIYKETELQDHAATVAIVHDWITKDLGLA